MLCAARNTTSIGGASRVISGWGIRKVSDEKEMRCWSMIWGRGYLGGCGVEVEDGGSKHVKELWDPGLVAFSPTSDIGSHSFERHDGVSFPP